MTTTSNRAEMLRQLYEAVALRDHHCFRQGTHEASTCVGCGIDKLVDALSKSDRFEVSEADIRGAVQEMIQSATEWGVPPDGLITLMSSWALGILRAGAQLKDG